MALLCAITASFLAVFLAALAKGERRRESVPLSVLLAVLIVLVVRGGLATAGLLPDAWLIDVVAMALFASVPFLVGFYAASAVGAHDTGWAKLSAGAFFATLLGFGALSLGQAPVGLSTGAWQAFAVGLQVSGVGVAIYLALFVRHHRDRRKLVPVLGVFGVHWTFSGVAWIAALFSSAGQVARAAEAASLVALIAFGGTVLVAAVRGLPTLSPSAPEPVPYSRGGLDKTERARLALDLRRLMAGQNVYLESKLNAAALAEKVGLSQRELSEVLNIEIGSSFFEFVNTYRVDEAARRLSDPARSEETVLEILYASGFNSKSAFHRAFRERIGKTPSAFRREHLPQRTRPSQSRRVA